MAVVVWKWMMVNLLMMKFVLEQRGILVYRLKAIANSLVGQVLARPLFHKVKQSSILQKASNKQKY